MRWLANQAFQLPPQQIVLQEAINAIEDCVGRLQRLDDQLYAIVSAWSMAPVVAAYQATRGVSFRLPFRVWFSMYRLMVADGTLPAVEHQYDLVHRLGSLRSAGNSSRSTLDV